MQTETICRNCGLTIQTLDISMSGRPLGWKHSDYPGTQHCIVDGQISSSMTAEPEGDRHAS